MPAGEYAIGPWKWDARYGSVAISYDTSGEWKDVKADGKNDSRKTWLGRKNAEIDIENVCKDDKGDGVVDGPINTYVRNMIKALGPRGANGGKPWDWTDDDQDEFNVFTITVDRVKKKRVPGTGQFTVTWKLSSWVKPVPGPVVTETPAVAGPWSPGPSKGQKPAAPKSGFGKTPPVVKP